MIKTLFTFDNPPISSAETASKSHVLLCRECGLEFEATHGGRRYCSEICRKANWSRQVQAWKAAHTTARIEFATCRHCLRVFEVPPRAAGRLPKWCSPSCKQAFLHPPAAPREPDMIDQLFADGDE